MWINKRKGKQRVRRGELIMARNDYHRFVRGLRAIDPDELSENLKEKKALARELMSLLAERKKKVN